MTAHYSQYDQSSRTPHLTSPDFPILGVVPNTVLLCKIGCGQVCRVWFGRGDETADGAFVVSPAHKSRLKHFRAETWRRPWRAPGFAGSLGAVSDSLAAIARTGGLPTASATFSGHPLLYTGIQTRLKVLGFVTSSDRRASKATVQSHGEGLSIEFCLLFRYAGRMSGRTASAMGPRGALLASSPAGPGRVNLHRPRLLVTLAHTISAHYPPAELKFIAKIFQKNPPRWRIRWKLIAAIFVVASLLKLIWKS
jgi:hypothetical protein